MFEASISNAPQMELFYGQREATDLSWPTAISVYAMTTSDIPEVIEFLKHYQAVCLCTWENNQLLGQVLAQHPTSSFVARDGKRVIGALIGGTMGTRATFNHIAVHEDYRGQGIGHNDEAAAKRVVARCAGLPLALQITAAQAIDGTPLIHVAESLDSGVGELQSGQLAVRASFASAYRLLSQEAQQVLRCVAVLPGHVFAQWAPAIAAGGSSATGKTSLAELLKAHLVFPSGNAYRMHDLIKSFAAELATDTDHLVARQILLNYVSLADRASHALSRKRLPLPASLAVPVEPIGWAAMDPYAWFDLEYPVLFDLLRHAASVGDAPVAAGIFCCIAEFLHARGLIDHIAEAFKLTETAAKAIGDDEALAYGYVTLTNVDVIVNPQQQGQYLATLALDLFRRCGNKHGEARALYELQYFMRRNEQVDKAIDVANETVALTREIGDTIGEAWAHQALGMIQREYKKDYPAARAHFETAIRLAGDEPASRDYCRIAYGLAFVYSKLGMPADAERYLSQSLSVMRANGDKMGVVTCLNRLADIWPEAKAKAALEEALALAPATNDIEVFAHVYQAELRLHKRFGDLPGALASARNAAAIYERIHAGHQSSELASEIRALNSAILAQESAALR